MARTLAGLGELGLIRRIARRVRPDASVPLGIGDDAAVVRAGRTLLAFASDMVVEGVHFHLSGSANGGGDAVPPERVGWKALACNVSDVAAMGGVPRWAVVSLGLPPGTPLATVDRLYAGLLRCARRYRVAIVGGDTVRAPQVVVDVAILGTVKPAHLARRSGARVGDAVFVTGRLGGSYPSGRHARFTPRLAEAQQLVQRFRIHAMIDLSDGLASDAWQIARASRVTLRVEAAALRAAAGPRCARRSCRCRRWGDSAAYHALMDGEDFELLFTVGPRDAGRMPARLGSCPVTRIGSVVSRGAGVQVRASDATIRAVAPEGFSHFGGRS
jgi:thiamine-monophosphate kinase